MEVAANIFIIKLPLPFKIDHVNCYLIRGNNGWVIIDTGLNYQSSTEAWESSFHDLNLKYSDIEGIYVTHYHPDHYGAAGWLQELTGAPVYMHRTESLFVDQMWKKGRANLPVVGELFKENGMPPSLIAEVLENMAEIWSVVQPHPKLSLLSGDEKVEMAGRTLEIINSPGHSDGHICFFCREEGILIAGDHLMPKVSSCISLWPTSYPNPLDLFLRSLVLVGDLPVKRVLPAHGPVFEDCRGRVQELLEHHRGRLLKIADLVGAGATAYHICESLYGDLDLNEIRFALTETLAYLAYLESRSEVHSRQENGIVIYRKAQSYSCNSC
jgi:glyoxylase-like metal-dependent hydrolase (beta-lactamase superfamily II)